MEKGYAAWNQTGREGRDGTNAYLSLADGWMQAVDSQVLGGAATVYYASACRRPSDFSQFGQPFRPGLRITCAGRIPYPVIGRRLYGGQ